jgi:BirA family biotin operon repressor/biotin-[acetyl-CoA-carboxylase] ligase
VITPRVTPWRFEIFSELPSTSDFCMARAKEGEPEGLAVFASRQSAGRGSRGRAWLSPPGNVALSVLLRPNMAPAQSSIFPLLAGIALAEAVASCLPHGPAPVLKWPNDILLNGEKCAGLLIDAAPIRDRIDWLVIGIGVNAGYAPELPDRVATCLAAHGATATALEIAEAILSRLAARLDTLTHDGAAAIIETWTQHAHPIGTPLQVKASSLTTAGEFAGLSPRGELLLSVENRIETFSTGEILLGGR